MAKVKVKFRPTSSKSKGKAGTIYYQICHKQKSRQITTGIHIRTRHWDEVNECIMRPKNEREKFLLRYQKKIDLGILHLNKIIKQFDDSLKPYHVSDITEMYRKTCISQSIMAFFREEIVNCKKSNKLGLMRSFISTYHSVSSFISGNDMPFFMISGVFLEKYETWLRKRGCVRNTTSFYMRILRSVYNKAVKCGLVEQTFPFKDVYTGVDHTIKRAVDEDVIERLQELDLRRFPPLALSRDLFVFSYFMRGMSFVDLAFLKKSDIEGGIISYVRRKTGQRLAIHIEPCMSRIIKNYEAKTAHSRYVFPIIHTKEPGKAYTQYKVALNYHNRKLKRLGRLLGTELSISSYTARHTWATNAHKHEVPLAIISAGMGHTSEKTTQIYLESIDNEVIDKVNKALLEKFNDEEQQAF
ncbi:MAG: site-specific integrase [Prevotella sp.]|nr:site-specific integrase [Prevotella sp.]